MLSILKIPFIGLPAFVATQAIAQSENPSPPNLLFIMADQWRGDAIGCIGKEPVKTPCLDNLASEGVNFTNAVSSYPVSSPARGMLMTGMYPHKSKVTGNCNSATAPYGVELPQDARCWSDVLKDNSYQTGYIGKWHLDSPYRPYVDTYNNRGKVAWNEWCPKERRHGFEFWEAYGTYDNHLHPMYWSADASRDSFHYVNQWGPEYEAGKAIEYLNKKVDRKRPFALVVSMNPPHTGYELVPDRYKDIYKNLDVEALCANRPDIPARGTEMGLQGQIPREVQTLDFSSALLSGKKDAKTVQPYYYIEPSQPSTGYRGLRTSTHTFAVHATDGKVDEIILFDRTADPCQMNNIAGEQPQLVKKLKKKLKAWLIKTDDSFKNYL